MIVHRMDQHSPEWFEIRAGIPTASEFDAIITPLWKARTGEGVDTYLAKKLAERWLGRPIHSFSGGAADQGTLREEEALPMYWFLTGEPVERVGFVTTDDGKIGCSPDGLIRDGGIEVKCPEPHTHCAYLLKNELPKDYAAQVHGAMYVTGAPWWKFMSYCPKFPPLLIHVQRDEKIIAAIGEAVGAFNTRLEAAYAKIVELNEGPSPREVQKMLAA